ncbi:hypothetical protein NDU88_003459 [Pleurodeles waltl]|uniref:Secreted protein n=1 Tax=Pleurodeles waltl TaxID=8319 RepID=A0AAV7MQL8_PLEWA|nr:hypothetical protein NDU88_003459 [Pleurodeles waltl]
MVAALRNAMLRFAALFLCILCETLSGRLTGRLELEAARLSRRKWPIPDQLLRKLDVPGSSQTGCAL